MSIDLFIEKFSKQDLEDQIEVVKTLLVKIEVLLKRISELEKENENLHLARTHYVFQIKRLEDKNRKFKKHLDIYRDCENYELLDEKDVLENKVNTLTLDIKFLKELLNKQ